MLGARATKFLSFGVLGGFCEVLGDPVVYLDVSGGPLGFPWDYMGCPWISGDSRSHRALEIIETPSSF